jgi:hypothetical protein
VAIPPHGTPLSFDFGIPIAGQHERLPNGCVDLIVGHHGELCDLPFLGLFHRRRYSPENDANRLFPSDLRHCVRDRWNDRNSICPTDGLPSLFSLDDMLGEGKQPRSSKILAAVEKTIPALQGLTRRAFL